MLCAFWTALYEWPWDFVLSIQDSLMWAIKRCFIARVSSAVATHQWTINYWDPRKRGGNWEERDKGEERESTHKVPCREARLSISLSKNAQRTRWGDTNSKFLKPQDQVITTGPKDSRLPTVNKKFLGRTPALNRNTERKPPCRGTPSWNWTNIILKGNLLWHRSAFVDLWKVVTNSMRVWLHLYKALCVFILS